MTTSAAFIAAATVAGGSAACVARSAISARTASAPARPASPRSRSPRPSVAGLATTRTSSPSLTWRQSWTTALTARSSSAGSGGASGSNMARAYRAASWARYRARISILRTSAVRLPAPSTATATSRAEIGRSLRPARRRSLRRARLPSSSRAWATPAPRSIRSLAELELSASEIERGALARPVAVRTLAEARSSAATDASRTASLDRSSTAEPAATQAAGADLPARRDPEPRPAPVRSRVERAVRPRLAGRRAVDEVGGLAALRQAEAAR